MVAPPFSIPPGLPADPALLAALLDLLPMGVIYYNPVVDAAGTLTDLALAYLNPTAQRMTQLPAQPATTYRQQFPTTDENGAWDFHRHSWLTPEPSQFQFYYDADGFDSYFRVTARRLGDGLLVVFTDTRDEVRTQVEEELRASQAREQAARAEAEAQQAELRAVFEQAPVAISLLQGPAHVIEFANTRMAQMWGRSLAQVEGQPHFAALPDLAGQGFEAIFEAVWRTGKPHYLQEQAVTINRAGQLYQGYFNITYQPSYNGQGQRTGLIASAIEVTEQVLARQQVEHLNQELEARVQARTQEALALQAELLAAAQRQVQARESFYQVFEQTPAAVSLLRGPSYRFEYVNPVYQQVFAGRQLVGRDFAEALPDAAAQGYLVLLDGVYQTGKTFFGAEVPFVSEQADAPPRTIYFNFTYQAYRENGETVGISTFALDVTEQVLARQEREAQRRKLYALFEQAPTGICILDGPELVFEFVNPTYQRLLPGRALLGQPILTALPELADTEVASQLRQVYATGETHQGQESRIPMARLDGSGELEDRYFTFVYQARRDEENRITGILNFVFEVTEQVRARQQNDALQAELLAAAQRQVAQRETFYQVFEQTPAVISLQRGPEHRYEYANAAHQRYFPSREALGNALPAAMPEVLASNQLALQDQVYQTGETYYGYEAPVHLAQPDGSVQVAYFNFSYQALREQNKIVGISTFAYDVSAQVQARQTQELQRQELEQLFWQAPTPIVILEGPELVFRLVNPAYQRIFPGRELLRKPLLVALPELADTPVPGLLRQVYQTGEPVVVQELSLLMARYEGQALEEIYWTFTYLARRDVHGAIDGVRVFAHDITEQVRTRQAVAASAQQAQALAADLATANQQLTRTNVDLDTFVYTASHDLKAPITNIESIALALRSALPLEVQQDELVDQLLELLNKTVARFQFTIGQLTDLSKLQLAHAGPAEPVNLAAVVESVRLDLVPAIEAAEAHLTVAVAPDLVVSFSPANLRSTVYNLLSNALKYRALDRPAQIRVRATVVEQQIVLTVQDNGLGLNAHQQQRLFGLFQRLHTHVEGTGVGLYITKRLVENGGGTIAVHSQVNVGTTFTVTFKVV